MIEEFTRRGANDFNRRYTGTFGHFLKEDGSKIMVMVEEVGEDSVRFSDKARNPYTANADRGNRFEFLPVEQGLYDLNNDLVYVSRRPARQWKRGICVDNTRLYSHLHATELGVTHPRLDAMFGAKPKDYFQKTLKDYCEGKRHGIALSQQFGCWAERLYIYSRCVGTVDRNNGVIQVEKMFSQELKDLVRDKELPFKVEVKDA